MIFGQTTNRFYTFILSFFLVLFLGACSTDEKKAQTAEDLFKSAQYFEENERFEEAIRRFNEVRQKFPYSKVAIDAELKIADVYYKQESFAESQIAYEAFREQHPQHEKADYVTYKIAQSYFEQLPTTIDRDLSVAPQALANFKELVKDYPESEFVADSQNKIISIQTKMAEKVKYIAEFYYKKKAYLSALERFEELLIMGISATQEQEVLIKAIDAAKKIGDIERAKRLESRIKASSSSSSEKNDSNKGISL